jgi:oligoribonuclease
MTGLDLDNDKLLEFASIITDDNLNIVSHEFEIVINQPDSILMNMNEWCLEQHGKVFKY